MKTRARTSRLVKKAFGTVLVLFLAINLYYESFSSSENPAAPPDREYRQAIQRSLQVSQSDTYLAKADSTNDYINLIGMGFMNQEDHSQISYMDEDGSEDSEDSDVSNKKMITIILADNKSILKKLFYESALKFEDQYPILIV